MEINIGVMPVTFIVILMRLHVFVFGITCQWHFAGRAVGVFVFIPPNTKFESEFLEFFYLFKERVCIKR